MPREEATLRTTHQLLLHLAADLSRAEVTTSFYNKLSEWRRAVREAATVQYLGLLFHQLLKAMEKSATPSRSSQHAKQKAFATLMGRQEGQGLRAEDMSAAVRSLRRAIEDIRRAARHNQSSVPRPSKRWRSGKQKHAAVLRERRAGWRDLVWSQYIGNELPSNGALFEMLPIGKQLAADELERLRSEGLPRSAVNKMSGVKWPWRTDSLFVPPSGGNCVLWMLQALIGASFTKLGGALHANPRLLTPRYRLSAIADMASQKDRLVVLSNDTKRPIDYYDLAAMFRRALECSQPLGCFELPRARWLRGKGWQVLLRKVCAICRAHDAAVMSCLTAPASCRRKASSCSRRWSSVGANATGTHPASTPVRRCSTWAPTSS